MEHLFRNVFSEKKTKMFKESFLRKDIEKSFSILKICNLNSIIRFYVLLGKTYEVISFILHKSEQFS